MTFIKKQMYLEDLSQGIQELWRSKSFTDIDVEVEKHVFPCHRIVLGSMSQYFNIMFSSGFRESNEKKITLQGIESNTFEMVLSYMYTGEDSVDTENVQQLLVASVMLQIKTLQNICDGFLTNHLSTENCIGIWKLASAHGLMMLEKTAWAFIMKHFPYICKGEEFQAIDKEDLIDIISNQCLYTSSEELVCEAVMNWVSADTEERKPFLSNIFGHLKLGLMSVGYLQDLLANCTVSESTDCQLIIEGIIRKKELKDFSDSESYRQENVMCMVGTRSRNPDPQKTEVHCYSFRHNQSFTLANIPKDPGPCFSVCTNGHDVYISGGYVERKLFLHFISKENRWEVSEINEGRWSHSMVAIGDLVYLIGGMSVTNVTLTRVDKFDSVLKTCTKIADLAVAVSSMTVDRIGDLIYVFGGKLGDRCPATVIQCINTKTGHTSVIGDLPDVCAGSVGRSVSLEDKIFLILREGHIVEFQDCQGNCTSTVVNTIAKFDHFGAFNHEGRIMILGSKSSQFQCFLFDPQSKQTISAPVPFKAAMCNFNCLKLVLSKKYLI